MPSMAPVMTIKLNGKDIGEAAYVDMTRGTWLGNIERLSIREWLLTSALISIM